MQEIPSLRVIFAGTPTFAAEHLQAILNGPHQVVAVYTQPDRPAGRGKKLTPSPVKQLALQREIPVWQPASLKSAEAQSDLAALNADVMVVVAYGLILPQVVLDTPRLGCINVHASLLPRWRGAAPIQRAIEQGDAQSGITIMQMDAGLDTGPMLKKITCGIASNDTSESLFNKLSKLGCDSINQVLNELQAGQLLAESQNTDAVTYAEKINKAEAAIQWQEPAAIIERKIRAFNPFPIAYSDAGDERVKIYRASVVPQSNLQKQLQEKSQHPPGKILAIQPDGLLVACGTDALLIHDIQLPGKKMLSVHAVLLGNRERFNIGDVFTSNSAVVS